MKNIAISAQWFLGWNGGVDFLKNIIQGLVTNQHYNYFVLIPQKEPPRKNKIFQALRFLLRNIPYFFSKDKDAEQQFSEFKDQVYIIHYRRNSLQACLAKHSIDLILPCAQLPHLSKRFPWIGYLPDCQHRHLAHLFEPREIQQRDTSYQKMVDSKSTILVNSVNAKNDLVSLYGATPDQIHSLPFCPTAKPLWLENNQHKLRAYTLPERYFMISNQFWIHKDHLTAL